MPSWLENLSYGVRNPEVIFRQINRAYHTKLGKYNYNPKGEDIIEKDWDNLIILDACRYDLLQAHTDELDKEHDIHATESRGASTFEFLTGNLSDRTLHDIVYVTSNPQLRRIEDRGEINLNFHDIVDVWHDGGWDSDFNTVLPEQMTQASLEEAHNYPNKRLIFHYLQPHYPFLTTSTDFDKGHLQTDPEENRNFWDRKLTNDLEVDKEVIWAAYEDTLTTVLPHINNLLENLDGKTVLTSDHGNFFGERSFPVPNREWGHPHGIYIDELVSVPWIEFQYSQRKEIIPERSKVDGKFDRDVVDSRLESLGYK